MATTALFSTTKKCAATAAMLVGTAGCTESTERVWDDVRKAEIASVLRSADLPLAHERPDLVAGKYSLMADSPYAFFRGTLPLYLYDWERNTSGAAESAFEGVPVLSVGDPHLENVGTLRASDGTLGLEVNDFDAASVHTYLWDVRRLATAVALGCHVAKADDNEGCNDKDGRPRDVAKAFANAYAETLVELADGAAPERIVEESDHPILEDLFQRAQLGAETKSELTDLTIFEGGQRRLKRGRVDPDDPSEELLDLPAWVFTSLPKALEEYTTTLVEPVPSSHLQVLDAARAMGSGVASFPRFRLFILVSGPTDSPDDDEIFELKELADAVGPSDLPSNLEFTSNRERIVLTSRAAWGTALAAPYWGTTEFAGFAAQVRWVSGSQKTVRTRRLRDDLGTKDALEKMASTMGRLLARVHASPLKAGELSPAPMVANVFRNDVDGFVDEQADWGEASALRALDDFECFQDALVDFGPLLGTLPSQGKAPPPDMADLYNGIKPAE
ncbi:MAG: DUF2252 family protein [Polyangiaceae bacterium]|nr:DUF2252 family protein [Polyangiaceae bacterium]